MTFEQLKNNTKEQSASITLDRVFPARARRILRYTFLLLFLASFSFSIFENLGVLSSADSVLFDGLSLLFLGVLFLLLHIEAFYNSSRFANFRSRLPESVGGSAGADFAVARILADTEDLDIVAGFLQSSPSRLLLARLDILSESVESYLSGARKKLIKSQVNFAGDSYIDFGEYASAIYNQDESLRLFLSSHQVNKNDFLGAAGWLTRNLEKAESRRRFWSRDNLESASSLATDWSYGMPVEARKYGMLLEDKVNLQEVNLDLAQRNDEVNKLENVLARKAEANAIIIDDDERVAETVLARLYKKMRQGTSLSMLEHKRIIILDWNTLVSEKNNKVELESELMTLLIENSTLGNIILYIPNFPQFLLRVKNIGLNPTSVFEHFLRSSHLQIVTHSSKTDFHYFIETNLGLLSHFERIIPEEDTIESTIPALLEKVETLETQWNIFYTYQSILEISRLAAERIVYGEMPEKALDLLAEITPWATREKIRTLHKSDVAAYVENKTGVPGSEISEEEGEKLEKLESILHRRIVGQEEAIKAVSSAMRRIRSGITNTAKPFASFLFLGPTGVGKTETCKALAEVFFGGEDKIIRFDMSEFNGADALPRLVGSFSEGRVGELASRLRDNPYGVLLLDELEKASPDVLDLFLQILDEGFFTDALDKKVNCRNLIIIATSNAGSQLIWQLVDRGQDPAKDKNGIIDAIIAERIFKPELLSRFDSVIIYSPLGRSELVSVAEKMFGKLSKRLETEKQIKISAAPDLLQYLVQEGTNNEFGARSINRVIQEKVEDYVARKIISKELVPGSILEIKSSDL